jgi:hypothetical protein
MLRTAWLRAAMFSAARFAEPLQVEVGVGGVAAHRQVRAVEQDGHAGGSERLLLGAHRLGDGEHVLLVRRVEFVARNSDAVHRIVGDHPAVTRANQQLGYL